MKVNLRRWLWLSLALVSLAFIFRVTLVPTSDPDTGTFQWCLLCGEFGLADFIANVILYVPAAVALRFSGVRARHVVGGLFLLSAATELLQLWIPGRESTLADILSNTLGALVGVGLAYWWPRRRRSAPGAIAGAAALLAAIALGGVVLRPRFPAEAFYGEWDDYPSSYEHYDGRVLSADIGGMPIPWRTLPDPTLARAHLRNGDTLLVRGIAGPAPRPLTQLFGVGGDHHRNIVLFGVHQDDFVFKVSTSAYGLLLQEPELYWPHALAGIAPGDTLVIAAWRAGKNYCLRLNGRLRCGVGYATDRLWTLIASLPSRFSGMDTLFGWVFVALLGLPVGLLAPRRTAGWIAVGALLLGAALVPPLVGLLPLSLADASVLVVSVAAGMLVPAPDPSVAHGAGRA